MEPRTLSSELRLHLASRLNHKGTVRRAGGLGNRILRLLSLTRFKLVYSAEQLKGAPMLGTGAPFALFTTLIAYRATFRTFFS